MFQTKGLQAQRQVGACQVILLKPESLEDKTEFSGNLSKLELIGMPLKILTFEGETIWHLGVKSAAKARNEVVWCGVGLLSLEKNDDRVSFEGRVPTVENRKFETFSSGKKWGENGWHFDQILEN